MNTYKLYRNYKVFTSSHKSYRDLMISNIQQVYTSLQISDVYCKNIVGLSENHLLNPVMLYRMVRMQSGNILKYLEGAFHQEHKSYRLNLQEKKQHIKLHDYPPKCLGIIIYYLFIIYLGFIIFQVYYYSCFIIIYLGFITCLF